MDHLEALEHLIRAGHSVASLERVLRLSAGYLSKVRHGAVTPSFQLAALLVVVAQHPEVVATLQATPAPSAPGALAKTTPKAEGSDAIDAIVAVVSLLDDAGIRCALLGVPAWVDGAAGQLDVVVHDTDRHALPLLREAGFLCAHHSSTLFRCRRVDAMGHLSFSLLFPCAPPLLGCFAHCVRRTVRGVARVPVVKANLTALWFLLGRAEDGLVCAQALVDADTVDVRQLRPALAALDAFPPTQSSFVLQTFDRALARERLARLREAV